MTTTDIGVSGLTDVSEDFFQSAYAAGWTDGLPVIPPTPARVRAMLRAVDRSPGEVVAQMPPRHGDATVEAIAANAVMAGCLPAYFPIVLAAVEAINDPMFPLGTLVGLRPETPFFLVNGPIRDEVELNYGRGCLGPGWRANATIGRAVRLIMINIGGMSPGIYARTCFSSPLQYTFCTAEDEGDSPWEPFHVERGFHPDESVISAFRLTSYIALLAPLDWDQTPRPLIQHTALSMVSLGNTAIYAGSLSALVLLNPERAHILADAGMTKNDVKELLYQDSQLPTSHFRPTDLEVLEEKGRITDGKVTLVNGPDEIQIAVLGGTGIHTVFLPGFSHEIIPIVPISKRIQKRTADIGETCGPDDGSGEFAC